ncbi:hypothetical protein VP01_26g11 [Puccinia sorghi]|uniref:Phosphatidylethanolamine-binding protein n=1 Tax=Puccinia sorghi TaxID=27349 RepID=A0A0L6V3S8_9BASI|nr:hypothetical protein VP01_26g11 [Puccinia sorghi]
MQLSSLLYIGLCCFTSPASTHHHTFDDDAILSRSRSRFQEARLVPDLLPAFNPQGTLAVSQATPTMVIVELHLPDDKDLRNPGFTLRSQEMQSCPEFQLFPGETGLLRPADTFTLIMLDPDSPTHANSSGAKLHLLTTGLALDRNHNPIEAYKLVNKTEFVVNWLSPTPEPNTGVHRYTFLLYQGLAAPESLQPFQDPAFNRSGFNLAQFTRTARLQEPYAATFTNLDSTLPPNSTNQSLSCSHV